MGYAAGGVGTNVEGLSDMTTGACFRESVPENRVRSANYPVNARSIASLCNRFGSGWALGGHPEASAHPDADWTRVRATGPASGGEAFPECIQVWLLPALRYGLALYVFRRRVGRHSQPKKLARWGKGIKVQCLSSNRSTMGPMIDSRKIHASDTAVESQVWSGHR